MTLRGRCHWKKSLMYLPLPLEIRGEPITRARAQEQHHVCSGNRRRSEQRFRPLSLLKVKQGRARWTTENRLGCIILMGFRLLGWSLCLLSGPGVIQEPNDCCLLGWKDLVEELGSGLVSLHIKGLPLAESFALSKNWPARKGQSSPQPEIFFEDVQTSYHILYGTCGTIFSMVKFFSKNFKMLTAPWSYRELKLGSKPRTSCFTVFVPGDSPYQHEDGGSQSSPWAGCGWALASLAETGLRGRRVSGQGISTTVGTQTTAMRSDMHAYQFKKISEGADSV